ncbi:LOW QUALITY PROTEIN: gamma-tubulin complex component 6-like [Saccoglossus kowalevskii]
MDEMDGITSLFSRLSAKFIDPELSKPHLVQPKFCKKEVHRRLRIKLYNELFKLRRGLHANNESVCQKSSKSRFSAKDKFFVLAYEYRKKRQFDNADRLEELVNSLPLDDHTELESVLSFLLLLANIDAKKPTVPVGHAGLILPIRTKSRKNTYEVMPTGPLCFGDGRVVFKPDNRQYIHYPEHLFSGATAGEDLIPNENLMKSLSVFDALPGQDLSGNGLFNVSGLIKDSYESSLQSSLFYGLTHSKVQSVEVELDLPELPDNMDAMALGLPVPKTLHTESPGDDEGYHESISSSSIAEHTIEPTEDIWEAALHFQPNRNHTWETIGRTPRRIERPYVSEAGAKVFDEVYKLRLQDISNIDPSLRKPDLNQLTQQQLVKDSVNVMIAVPSDTYKYDESKELFIIQSGTHMSGTSPESFQCVLQQFSSMGTNFQKLSTFCTQDTMSSFYSAGLVFQAFSGVLKYLRIYQSMVLGAPTGKNVTVLLLYNLYQKWATQLRNNCLECLFTTQHHLCNSEVDIPRLMITLCVDELRSVQNRKNVYITVMNQIARLKSMSIEEKEIRAELAKQQLLVTAKRTAAKELMRIKDEMKQERMAADVKKRKHFQELKEEMEKSVQRRAMIVEKEKEEDEKRVEDIIKKEQDEKNAASELEKQTREEIIEYYNELSAEAAIRELRALWKIRRHQLDDARIEFMRQNEINLKQALEDKKNALERALGLQQEVSSSSVAMPTSARLSRPTNSIVPGQPDIPLSTFLKPNIQEPVDQDDSPGISKESSPSVRPKEQHKEKQVKTEHAASNSVAGNEHSAKKDVVDNLITLDDITIIEDGKPNENIEDALSLVRDMPSPAKSQSKVPMNLLDFSINDFLPKDPKDGKVNESLEETSGEATLDDILLDIGSSLPTQSHDVLNEPPTAQHPSDDIAGDILYPDAKNTKTNENLPSTNAHGHPSESTFTAGGVSVEDVLNIIKPNVHGHTSDSIAGCVIYSTQGSEDPRPSANVHGHPSDSKLSGSIYSSEGAEESRPLPNIYGHPSDSGAFDDVVAVHMPRANEFGHASEASAGHVIYSTEGVGENLPVRSMYGHSSDSTVSSVLYPENARYIEEYEMTKRLLNKMDGKKSDEDGGDDIGLPGLPLKSSEKMYKIKVVANDTGVSVSPKPHPSDSRVQNLVHVSNHAPGKKTHSGADVDYSLNPVVFVQQKRHLLLHPSDSSVQSMMYPEPGDLWHKEPTAVQSRNKPAGRPSDSKNLNLVYGMPKLSKRGRSDGESGMDQVQSRGQDLGMRAKALMYPGLFNKDTYDGDIDDDRDSVHQSYHVWLGDVVEPLRVNFDVLSKYQKTDLLANAGIAPVSSELGDYGLALTEDDNIQASELYCLPVILKRSITSTLTAQINLVNRSILDYFMVDLNIDRHFESLRHFLFLEDGEFGHRLCHQLFERLAQGATPVELLSPMSLNSILAKALQAAVYGETKFAENLSFALKYYPLAFKRNSIDALDCLELRYKVAWPLNIVITESSMMKYNKILSFMLQLKRASWVLRDVYFHLKRSALMNHAGNSTQFRHLQLFRHEMQHFVHVMQGYMSNQVVHVSWLEFQQQLKEKVHNLDDLHHCHAEYLNKAVFRSLLNDKASAVMKIITNILCLILKFRTQLVSVNWHYDPLARHAVHPAFENMKASFKAFKEYSGFLYKLVNKLTRGYQPHLDDFILRLNFNGFYDNKVGLVKPPFER